MYRLTLFLPLALAACVATPPFVLPAPAPAFDPIAFFEGPTHGEGVLRRAMGRSRATHVEGNGRVEGGTLVLDQDIGRGDGTARHRRWRIRRDGPGRYTGTLTDAAGATPGDVEGNRLHLAFTTKGGLKVQQWLTLAADGRSAHNVLVVTKLGMRVAVLVEEIVKG